MHDCCCCAIGCNRRSTYCDMDSVGPSQPDTIGRIPGGVLCIVFKKYIWCVLGFVEGLIAAVSRWIQGMLMLMLAD